MQVVPRVKKEKKFTKEQQRKIAELVTNSTCRVLVFRNPGGGYFGVHIEFTGPLAHFPSTSNDRDIGYLWGKNRFQQKTRRPFIKLTDSARVRLQAAKQAFTIALCTAGHYLPYFGSTPVSVLALFADKSGRWDSHNMSKPLGDWLEDVGIIDDDANADIDCKKLCFFPWSNRETTRIIIQPFSQVVSTEDQAIESLIRTSTGTPLNALRRG